MNFMRSILGWGLLLSFALLAPVSLPAGGISQSNLAIKRLNDRDSRFAGNKCYLRASPSLDSPSLRTLCAGTPIRVLRIWHAPDGGHWVQVKLISINFTGVIGSVTRGWVNV